MTTSELTEAILLAASEAGHLLLRNNSGVAVSKRRGKTYRVRYGVGPKKGGGGDLIGMTRTGRFASVEIKVGSDRQKPNQKTWEAAVRRQGGVAGVARSVADALAILEG